MKHTTTDNHIAPSPSIPWLALQYFNFYRFLIALLFVMLHWMDWIPYPLASYQSSLFTATAHIYLLLSFIIAFFIQSQAFPHNLQLIAHVLIDSIAITLLMYADNGVSSGFGVLLVISVIGGGILCADRTALLFAAIATLMVLAQEGYLHFSRYDLDPNYPHAGFLGLTFFATAFLGQFLARRVKTSEALLEQRAVDIENLGLLNEYIVQRLQSGLVVLDDDYRIVLLNEAAKSLLGLHGNYQGQNFKTNVSPLFEHVRRWRQGQGSSIVILSSAQSDKEVRASFTSLSPTTGFIIMVVLDDIVQLRQQAQDLKVASLGRLAASIAHEVRNPLGAIGHAGQLLSESGGLADDDKRLAEIIVGHTKRVNKIVQNMMRISRRNATVLEDIELGQWMRHFIAEFVAQKKLDEADIRVVGATKDVTVKMDSSQLYEVIWNLSENALQYSRGQPLLNYQWGVDQIPGQSYLEVIDYGTGIASDHVPQLFEPFFTTHTSGSGLGLYIARELCEANQASLILHKNTRKGCCFRIHFA